MSVRNAGAYSFAAALQPHRPQVHAFEPEPYSLAWLRRNVQINDVRNVAVYGVALTDKSGASLLYLPSWGHGTSPLLERARGDLSLVTTLDEWAADPGAPGRESMSSRPTPKGRRISVLRGGRTLIERDRPFIICEVWPDAQIEEALTSLVDQLGYLAYHLTATGLD